MPAVQASRVRIALIDDDSGLETVLERRFEALGWDHEVLAYPAGPDQLAALRIHALIVNPALTGLDYIEQTRPRAARAGAAGVQRYRPGGRARAGAARRRG